MRLTFILAISLALPSAAVAQMDYIGVHAQSMQTGEMYKKMFRRRDNQIAASTRTAQQPQLKSSYAAAGGALLSPPNPGAAAIDLRYRSTPELRKSAADAYVQRVMQSDPQAGKLIAAEVSKNNFSRIYAGIVAPFGYRADDTADAVAAYTLLGWLIATGSPDPSPAAARAVREQVAQGLSNDPKFTNPRTRAELAEEMKLLFVTLHAGWQSARKEGNLRTYADGVAAMFKRFTGNDLRAMRLTERGFVGR
ncbi:hypothetical protein [Glacieibacterium frigidum]|uniref:Uncharacterized protein n=1 Tax=Glacieibacterium frigidum TaxID=2593303 RepID=A0A552UGK3_9SPHN|nr:hypothetical protein [Glacieibacterium frigidum]TRW17358.1 hypothetical protein FMM06_04065 [Glacieibacterium frigidum]